MANQPYLYQLLHPWHWLTYGQNATAIGIVLAAILSILSIYVLARTLHAVNRQAVAADRQAEAAEAQAIAARKLTEVAEQQRLASERAANAAEEQVAAARSSTAVSDAQRIATEQSALAEREHSDLIRIQILASMRPFVVVGREPNPAMAGSWQYFALNHGEGVALDVAFSYRNGTKNLISISQNILGPGQRAILGFQLQHAQQVGLQARYSSQDGRLFVTTIELRNQDFIQTAFEVDKNGGWLAQPAIPTSA
jgi:hypothetical protein